MSFTPSATATETPTFTPSATASATLSPTTTPSPTDTPTVTATSTMPVFSQATFTYDGDGKRVQAVIQTNYASTTTSFVGNYYEVTGSSISLFICASITGLVYGIVSGMLLSGWTPTRWVLRNSPRRFREVA